MKLKGLFATLIAVTAGFIVLTGTLIPIEPLVSLRSIFLQWASILAGIAILLGVGNLVSVHVEKTRQRDKNAIYSLALLLFLGLTFLLVVSGIRSPLLDALLNQIMVPVEISLTALLSVTLLYAAIRLLRQRADLKSILFILTAFIVLLASAPWPLIGPIPVVSDLFRYIITQVLAAGGARGMLIGIALGTLLTGLRVLIGSDRPYGDKS